MKENKEILLSIIIPAYNGETFLNLSLHSLLNETIKKEDLMKYYEIILINDGSKDNTYSIASSIAKKWNDELGFEIMKVIDKKNGQYGSVINRGIKESKGKYFKVLDVDDTFDVKHFISIIQILLGLNRKVDVIFTDFTFEKALNNKQISYSWRKYFEPYKVHEFKNVEFPNNIITMHSIIYNLEFLKKIKYKQVEGIYYSDSQYSIIPLSQAKTMYYINLPFYKYYIGRNEQSINIKVMVKNREQQKLIMNTIVDELLNLKFNSFNQEKYAWRIARNMFEWQSMLVAYDKSIPNKNKYIYNETISYCKKLKNNPFAQKNVNKSILIKFIKIGKGLWLSQLIKIGAKLYSKFKLNIMADWD